MSRTPRPTYWIPALVPIILLAVPTVLLTVPTAHANIITAAHLKAKPRPDKEHCTQISAKIKTEVQTAGCESPVGLCTTGTMEGKGLLHGPTQYVATAVGPAAGDPNPAVQLTYTGNLIINTEYGQLTTTNLGILDKTGGSFSELTRALEGTETFQGATGKLFFYGNIADTGFSGEIKGRLCFPPKAAANALN